MVVVINVERVADRVAVSINVGDDHRRKREVAGVSIDQIGIRGRDRDNVTRDCRRDPAIVRVTEGLVRADD